MGSHWETLADRLIQMVTIERAARVCELCGAAASAGHHIIHRSAKAVRHVEDNVIAVCHACHDLDNSGMLIGEIEARWPGRAERIRLMAYQTDGAYDPQAAAQRLERRLNEIKRAGVIGWR